MNEPYVINDIHKELYLRMRNRSERQKNSFINYPVILNVRGQEAVLQSITFADGVMILSGENTEMEIDEEIKPCEN